MDKGFWERFAGLYDLVMKTRGAAGFSPAWAWTADDYVAFLESHGLAVEQQRLFEARQPLCVAVARMPGVTGRGRAHAD